MATTLNALSSVDSLNSYIEMANKAGAGVIAPSVFYSKQLLDTIRYDASEYIYFRLADPMPIQEKAEKLMVRRWAPLQAHTVPLEEGVPPLSDKGSVEKYEISAKAYGRFMEFTDKVDYAVVDPVIAHYTKEYSLVAMETLDLLAKEALLAIAQQNFAGQVANISALKATSKPSLADLRLIILTMKKAMVKPRMNGRFQVIGSPEFYYDMISDPLVEKFMTINNSTKTMYENSKLVPLFEMEFYESPLVPTTSEAMISGVLNKMIYRVNAAGDGYEYLYMPANGTFGATPNTTVVSGFVKDSRTGQDASYIPNQRIWADINDWAAHADGGNKAALEGKDWQEFKVQHILILGKDALVRTGLSGEDNVKMYVKEKGSAGVLDPIDQRQSIGFKINSVGFASTRLEAVHDYICVPTQIRTI